MNIAKRRRDEMPLHHEGNHRATIHYSAEEQSSDCGNGYDLYYRGFSELPINPTRG